MGFLKNIAENDMDFCVCFCSVLLFYRSFVVVCNCFTFLFSFQTDNEGANEIRKGVEKTKENCESIIRWHQL